MKIVAHIVLLLAGLATMAPADVGGKLGPAATVRDHGGRVMAVAAPFERIISLYGAHTENLFAMGAGGRVMGVTRHDTYPPGAREKAVFSYHDGLERFLAAGPDLVLIRPMIDRGYGPLVNGLEKHGVAVFSLQPGSIDEMYAYWRLLGQLAGRQDQAETMIMAFQQAVDRFRALSASVRDRKRVYFEAIHDRMKTFTPGSMPIFALETAGGLNVAADAAQVRTTNIAFYGKERILSRAGEIDVYLAQRGVMNQPTLELIRNEPGYDVIKAIKNNQLFIVDETIVARPTWRLLYGINAIGNKLYPERFRDKGLQILRQAESARAGEGSQSDRGEG